MSSTITPPEELQHRSSWFAKFVECMFTAIAALNVLLMFGEIMPERITEKLGRNIFAILLIAQVVIGLLFGTIYSIYWHLKENKNAINSGKRHAWFRGILRYWLAFEISTYGFAKILKTQFAQAYYRDDTAVGNLSGFELTWNYFAHSYALAVIIACMQIGGSILLLFRRTTLAGVLILLPVMVNIVLINLFYSIAPGAFLNSVLFTLGLLYLFFLRWPAFRKILFAPDNSLPLINLGFLKTVLKFVAIAAAFSLIYYFTTTITPSNLTGKWKITQFIRNKDTLQDNAWLTDQFAWKNVYIEEQGRIALCPNPYIYETERTQWAKFDYDSTSHIIRLFMRGDGVKKDSLTVSVNNREGDKMQWNTIFKSDTLVMKLSRIKK